MKYLIFLLLPIFAACNHNPNKPEVSTPEVVKRISIPAELLQKCPELKISGSTLVEEIILEDLDIIAEYGNCRKRNSKLIDTIQEVVK